jgi:hypothetical protein
MFRYIIYYLLSLIILLPFFFINYRLTAFHTFPFDHYYEYILALSGSLDRSFIDAPGGYRIVYYGTAYIFYKILPFIPLSKLTLEGGGLLEETKALQALAFTSYLFLHAFFYTTFLLIRIRMRRSMVVAIGMAALTLLLSLFAYPHGADPSCLFYISLCLFFINNYKIFYSLLLFSPCVNEKISMIFGLFFFVSLCFKSSRSISMVPFIISCLSFLVYLFMLKIVALPVGIYGYQTDLSQLLPRLAMSWPYLVTFKGFYTNWLPLIILCSFALLGLRLKVFNRNVFVTHPAICFMPGFLFILGLFTCTDFGIGRVAMHALPFYSVPIMLILERLETES